MTCCRYYTYSVLTRWFELIVLGRYDFMSPRCLTNLMWATKNCLPSPLSSLNLLVYSCKTYYNLSTCHILRKLLSFFLFSRKDNYRLSFIFFPLFFYFVNNLNFLSELSYCCWLTYNIENLYNLSLFIFYDRLIGLPWTSFILVSLRLSLGFTYRFYLVQLL